MICQLEDVYYFEKDKKPQEEIKKLKCQCYMVIMQLNPDNKEQKELCDKILKMQEFALNNDPEFSKEVNGLVFDFQRILKQGWEQIKEDLKPIRSCLKSKLDCIVQKKKVTKK